MDRMKDLGALIRIELTNALKGIVLIDAFIAVTTSFTLLKGGSFEVALGRSIVIILGASLIIPAATVFGQKLTTAFAFLCSMPIRYARHATVKLAGVAIVSIHASIVCVSFYFVSDSIGDIVNSWSISTNSAIVLAILYHSVMLIVTSLAVRIHRTDTFAKTFVTILVVSMLVELLPVGEATTLVKWLISNTSMLEGVAVCVGFVAIIHALCYALMVSGFKTYDLNVTPL